MKDSLALADSLFRVDSWAKVEELQRQILKDSLARVDSLRRLSDTLAVDQIAAVEEVKVKTPEEIKAEKAAAKAKKKADRQAEKEKRQKEKEERWAEMDKRDEEKLKAKQEKALEKIRQKKRAPNSKALQIRIRPCV